MKKDKLKPAKKENGNKTTTSHTEVKSKKFNPSDHWKDMPEFNQPGIEPIKSIKVNFLTKEDMLKFSRIVGQEITAKTQSIWYPIWPEETALDKRWSDKKLRKK